MTDSIPLPAHFGLGRYRIALESQGRAALPADKGRMLRGALGFVLKGALCARPPGRVCAQECLSPDACLYAFLFEGRPPSGAQVLRAANRIPPPYVLEPPPGRRREFERGDLLTFHLVLAGSAARYVPYLLAALREAGARGLGRERARFRLVEASAIAPGGAEIPLYDPRAGTLAGNCPPAPSVAEWAAGAGGPRSTVTLDFLTPTRLKDDGRIVGRPPSFQVVVRALLRRLSSLSVFYGGAPWTLDFRRWIELARPVEIAGHDLRWCERPRFSTRQRQEIPLGGLTGPIAYRGPIGPFLPLLRLGELIHVGKGATSGNGRYRLE